MIINYVPDEISNPVLELLESDTIPWLFAKESVMDIDTDGYYDSPQFTYTLVDDMYAGTIDPAIHKLWQYIYKNNTEAFETFTRLSRIKCNMVTRGVDSTPHVPHLDRYTPHYVIVYYVNDSDGNTYIQDEHNTTINPEKGKYVIFDGSLKHCGSSPVEANHRLVINFNIDK